MKNEQKIISQAMRILGKKRSAKKSAAAAINGKKGGRPKKRLDEQTQ